MDISPQNKIKASFGLVSMLNLVFLMLIFFMLTSSFVTPSGLPVNLPGAKGSIVNLQKVSVTITKDLQYYINEKKVTKATLEGELKRRLGGSEGSVIVNVDKDVPSEHLVHVVGLATSLEAKVVIATKPE